MSKNDEPQAAATAGDEKANEGYNDPGLSGPPPIATVPPEETGNAAGATYTGAQNDNPENAEGADLTAEGIDDLKGEELDAAVEAAGIDSSTGGSLSDGSMSAEEKREALKEHHSA